MSTQTLSDKVLYQKHKLIVDRDGNGHFIIYFCKESDLSIIDFLQFRNGCECSLKRVPLEEISKLSQSELNESHHEKDISKSDRENQRVESPSLDDNKIIRQINQIISEAIDARASDIHFEPSDKFLNVRTRIDGVLFLNARISTSDHPEIISRIKIMSGLDIAEKRRPQDGRIRFDFGNRLVDIRVSIIPTDFGEKAVLRILDKEQLKLNLDSLGFTIEQLHIFRNNISATSGIILVTGPTGSGKTTTLYAVLNTLKSGNLNISTVEDPIEYNLEGINQTQVKPEINLTFSAMLRALLRQDPNIIMVGEIRDRETLDIAIRASQTGHLVLSTVHTNSAISTITRLLDMGTESFLLSSSLRMIVAQRLVRKNCDFCRVSDSNEDEVHAAKKLGISRISGMMTGKGCTNCSNSGYRGRIAIYEILPISEELREIIHKRGSEKELLNCAVINSFKSMKSRALELIEQGITTPSEVIRELGAG